jgi:hypothetical protein
MSNLSPRKLSQTRQAKYSRRKRHGLKPVLKPWHWLTLDQVQELAKEAYHIASYDLHDVTDWPQDPAAHFAEGLASAFEVLTAAVAQKAGIRCAPARAEGFAQHMRAGLAPDWRPQYPMYQKLTPASATNASGAVINADEGNVNDRDFKL